MRRSSRPLRLATNETVATRTTPRRSRTFTRSGPTAAEPTRVESFLSQLLRAQVMFDRHVPSGVAPREIPVGTRERIDTTVGAGVSEFVAIRPALVRTDDAPVVPARGSFARALHDRLIDAQDRLDVECHHLEQVGAVADEYARPWPRLRLVK
ncbi:MAG: hypothetical protein K2X99_10180 [Gemmatimonadaceae bacterium]|nr:hypothetical protein [Gemmatimonadaceae bacterium]